MDFGPPPAGIASPAKNFLRRLRRALNTARKARLNRRDHLTHTNGPDRSRPTFFVGDAVKVKVQHSAVAGKSKKLAERWKGPYLDHESVWY